METGEAPRHHAAQEDQDVSAEDWLWVESADGDDRSSSAVRTSHAASELGDGTSSCHSPSSEPTSETVANMVLTQPLQLPQVSSADPGLAAAAAKAATAANVSAGGTGSLQQQQQPQHQAPHSEQPKPTRQQQLAAAASAAASAASAGLSGTTAACSHIANVAKREWYNLLLWLDRALASAQTCLGHATAGACRWLDAIADAACMRLEQASEAASACLELTQVALQQQLQQTLMITRRMIKGWQAPSWALMSAGAVTTVSVLAIGSLMWRCQSLSAQLKQRDRDLAQLVMRIMHLQESLHNSRAAVPVVRHLMQPGGGGFMVSNLA